MKLKHESVRVIRLIRLNHLLIYFLYFYFDNLLYLSPHPPMDPSTHPSMSKTGKKESC